MLDVTDNENVEAPPTAKVRTSRPRPRSRRATETNRPTRPQGLTITRRLSTEGTSPFDTLDWERRLASIGGNIFRSGRRHLGIHQSGRRRSQCCDPKYEC